MLLAAYALGLLLLGAAVGVISAAIGLGGGIVMVPAFLTFIPGMDAHTAKGTSLFIILFVALANAWRLNRGLPEKPWRMAAAMSCGSLLGGYAGAWITARMSEAAVVWIFVAFLGLLAVRTFFLQTPAVGAEAVRPRHALAALIGVVSGLVGGATGTGGGVVLVPLALLTGCACNARVVGLSNMVMVVTSAAGSIAHFLAQPVYAGSWTVGQVWLPLVPLVFLGAQMGSPYGVRLNARLSLRRRRWVLGAVLAAVAARMLIRALS